MTTFRANHINSRTSNNRLEKNNFYFPILYFPSIQRLSLNPSITHKTAIVEYLSNSSETTSSK